MKYFLFLLLLFCNSAWAESTRIEVYPLSQTYWDTKSGETLGEIVEQLMPDNPYLQKQLLRDIVAQNPRVFIGGNPNRMLANKRLWLPNSIQQTTQEKSSSNYTVQSFQWGSIKTRDKDQ